MRLFASVKRYVGFKPSDSALLASFHRHVKPRMDEIVEDFYARIEAEPRAMQAIQGGPAQIERLKGTLRAWLSDLLLGPHDGKFARRQALIGNRHVMVGLDQAYSMTGIYVFREHLHKILLEAYPKRTSRRDATQCAVSKVLTVVSCLMLETYRESYVQKVLRAEQNATMKRLAMLGEMAASIAHEIRNPLAGISGAIQVLTSECPADDPKCDVLAEIGKEVQRLNRKVTEMLIFARPASLRLEPSEPREILKLATRLIPADPAFTATRFVVRVEPSLPRVLVDPEQVQQVLLNLVLNAAQAMNGAGRIRLEAADDEDGFVRFAVEDTGPGVAAEIADRIFKPFFTTRPGGTGLGLAISAKIVESHGGTIVLARGRGGSARFVFRLPVAPSPVSPHTRVG